MTAETLEKHEAPFGISDLELRKSFFSLKVNDLAISTKHRHFVKLSVPGERISFGFEIETPEMAWELPVWFPNAMGRFAEILALGQDWDSYGAQPINHAVVEAACWFLLSKTEEKTPEPSIVPMNNGGVQLEWHEKGIDLEIAIRVPGLWEICFEDSILKNAWERILEYPAVGVLDEPMDLLSNR